MNFFQTTKAYHKEQVQVKEPKLEEILIEFIHLLEAGSYRIKADSKEQVMSVAIRDIEAMEVRKETLDNKNGLLELSHLLDKAKHELCLENSKPTQFE